MTRLLPPLLTAAAIWAVGLAEGRADDGAMASADNPTCQSPVEAGAPRGDVAPAPESPEPVTGGRS